MERQLKLDLLNELELNEASSLIEQFLKKGVSEQLGLNCGKKFPSTELIIAARNDENIKSKLETVYEHLMKNYKFDKDEKYLEELIILSSGYMIPYTKQFLSELQKNGSYEELNGHIKWMVQRGIRTFENCEAQT